MLLEADGRLTKSAQVLIGAMGGVPAHLLREAVVRPHTEVLLRFPWYPKARGGAFVLGRRIYVQSRQWRGAHARTGEEPMHTFATLTHEAGHLPQAARFALGPLRKTRYVLWALGQYSMSALRHGLRAHDHATLEVEADEGRWVLMQLLERDGLRDELRQLLLANDVGGARDWVDRYADAIATLRDAYRAKHPKVFTPR
jgi:hypothetical protein